MVTTAQVPVGTVSSLKGRVSVIPAHGGAARPLHVGDVIHPGDRIVSAAGAEIQVKDAQGALWSPRDTGTLVATDATAEPPSTTTAKAKAAGAVVNGENLDDVIAAVNTGNAEDATAAGLAGGGGGGTLGEGLRVDRVTEVVNPQEFNYGTGDRAQAQGTEAARPFIAQDNNAPVITDTPSDPGRPTTRFDPVTGNYQVTTPEDTPVSGQVKATDADGDALTFTLGSTSPAHGTVVVNADGTWTYTPGKDYNGADSFTVVVSDGNGGTATSTVSIGVTPVNDPPKPDDPDNPAFDPATGNYKVTTNEDTPVSGQVKATDADGDTLTFTLGDTKPAHGTVEVAADGSYTYTPGKDYSGSDSFTVVVDDGHGGKVSSTVTVNIAPVADIPVVTVTLGHASADVVTITKDNATATDQGFKVTATNFDGSAGTVSTVSGSNVAGFGVAGGVSTDTQVDGQPGELGNDSATQHSEKLSVAFDQPASSATVQFSWLSPTEHAAYTLYDASGNVIGSGVVTGITDQIDPAITLKADNGAPISRIEFTAPGAHDDYVINNVTYVKSESIPITVTATPTDIDHSEHVSALVVSVPGDATLSVGTKNADGTWTLPLASSGAYQVVVDPVTHAVTVTGLVMTLPADHAGDVKVTVTATVYDTVTSVTAQGSGSAENHVPELTDPNVPGQGFDPATGNYKVTTAEDTPVSGQVKATDADGDTLTYTLGGTAPAHGTVVVNTDGTWTYTPKADYNGTDTFTVTVSDGKGGTATSTVSIGVTPVNDAPVAANDSSTTPEDRAVVIDVRANDKDADGDTLTVTQVDGQAISTTQAVTLAGQGVVSLNADGTLTFTPAADYNGQVRFNYTVQDPSGTSSTANVTVDVPPLSDTPVAVHDTATTPEDTVVVIDVLANDSDADGDKLGITAINGQAISTTQSVTLAGQGVVSLNADGTLTFSPAANYHGKVEFTYTVTDGQTPVNGNVTVNVTPVNDAPVAADDRVTTPEDTAIEVDVRANDRDADSDTLTVTAVTQAAHGTVTINPATGNPVYTPAADYNGTDTFTYTVTDPSGATSTATVTVTVGAVNDAPQAQADVGATDQNGTLTVSAANGVIQSGNQPTGRDSDPDGDTLAVTGVSHGATAGQVGQALAGQYGTLTLQADGGYTYVPNDAAKALGQGATGQDVFSYTVKDAGGLSSTTTLSITVTGTNDAPVAVADRATTPEDTPVVIRVLDNDSDADGDKLGVTQINGQDVASGGQVSLKDGAGVEIATVKLNADGTLTLTPAADYNGPVNFVYTVSDGQGGTGTGTVNVVVDNVNDAPIADHDVVVGVEDTTFTFDPRANDTDPDGDKLTITQINGQPISTAQPVTLDKQGVVSLNADGTLSFQPADNFNGQLSFEYTVSDGKGGTDTATVNMTVKAVNDPPVITDTPTDPNHPGTTYDPTTGDYKATTPEDTPVSGQVKASDVDGDTLTFTLGGTAPAHGTVVVNTDGTWTYTPAKDYNGSDAVTVTVSDGKGGTATSTVTIGVTPVNDNPTANPDQVTVAEDSVVTFDPRSNDSDVDGDSLSITAVNGHAISLTTPVTLPEGTISLNANGTLTFTPAPNYNGTLSLTYTVSDGHGGTAEAPITIDVTPVDDVAMIGSGSVSLSEEGLAGGIADSSGSPDTTNATSASGKLALSDVDGGPVNLTISGPAGLTSGGVAITWSGTGTADNPLVGSAGGKTIITASIDSSGNYQVSLQGAIDHANTAAEDVRSVQLTVQSSNGGNTSTGTLTLNIEDDSPATGGQTQYVSPATQSTNVMLVVDVSGSMKNALADTTINGLKATIKGLLDHYGELGDVRVQIVTFSDSASSRATWLTLADAKTFIDKLSANGGTNYDAALASAQTGFNVSGKLAGAVNVSYFFSDGEPTQGREVDTGSDKTKWEAFLKANDIDSYAMGINGASSSNLKYLEPIAYNGASETERPAVILTSNTAVKTYLDNSVVTVEHGSLSGLAGADGLKAVTAFSAANQTSSTFDAATGIQTITLSTGSRIELNLATGEYTYTRPAGNTGDTFSYTVVDKDGDKGSGTLTLTTVNHAPEGTDGTVSLTEDSSYHLQVSDFGFKDSDVGDRLSVVRIDTLPTDGQLTLGGKAVVAGQVIAASDIGSLVFKPDANENGATYAKLTFSVADRAGVYDSTPNTLTFNVTPVNDAPIARIASHGGLLGLVDVSVDPILNFSSHQHLGVYDVDNNLTRIDISVKNLLSVGGLANDLLGLIGLGGDHSKLTIDAALAQSYGFTVTGNDTRHLVITSATAGGTVDYALVNKLLATLVYDPAELLGVSADLLPTMTIKATDAYGLSSTDSASAGLVSVHVNTLQDVLDTKVDVSASATLDSAVTLTHDALSGEFTHAIDVGLSVSTPLTLTGHSASSDVFAWSLSTQGTTTASTGTNGTTLTGTHAVDTIVDFDTAARSAGGDVLDLRDLLSGEHTLGGTGNLSQFLDFDTTSQPGSTVVHVSTTGGFTAGYDAKAEDQTIVLQNVNLRGDLGLNASASDNQVIAELMTRGKLLVDNH